MYDLIIIGAGPAGLSAALYASRQNLKTLVLSKDLGGQTAMSSNMENYPGAIKLSGFKLIKIFEQQAESFGAEIILNSVRKIIKQDNDFLITTDDNKTYKSKSIILAFGRVPKKLNVKGEKEFLNKGVTYCATCDASLFTGKNVAVVGGGNAAVDAALLLSQVANKVYLIHRRDEFRAENLLVERIKNNSKIELVLSSVIEEIKGDNFVDTVIIKNLSNNQVSKIKIQGVFIEVGFEMKSDFIKQFVKLNEIGEIIIDKLNQTSLPGVFAAGDVTIIPFKQTIISAGQGAIAALSAYNYVNNLNVSKLDNK